MTLTYLVYIGISQQRLFRKVGSIKGYLGDYFIVSVYFLLLFSLAQEMAYPIVQFMIVEDESFECSRGDQIIITILRFATSIFKPIGYQILFLAMIWQLVKIQDDIDNIEYSENSDLIS